MHRLIILRSILHLRVEMESLARAEVVLGAKQLLAVAVGGSRCPYKLKLVSQMVGCLLSGTVWSPLQDQQVPPFNFFFCLTRLFCVIV